MQNDDLTNLVVRKIMDRSAWTSLAKKVGASLALIIGVTVFTPTAPAQAADVYSRTTDCLTGPVALGPDEYVSSSRACTTIFGQRGTTYVIWKRDPNATTITVFANDAVPGGCIDGGGGSSPVYPDSYLGNCNNSNINQQWRYKFRQPTFQLQNVANGKCLDGGGNSGDIYGRDCDANNQNTFWRLLSGGGHSQLQNVATGLCIDGGGRIGAPIYPRACSTQNGNLLWRSN
ncbi:RICIN domain-containing protein [Actinoplanes sp. CA-030573]|uniref:RICIN domain-containing protein n=1 Tax=Actinoplanes sp. CA-030573 TaxID=3239898 RepID=UPI003D94AB30